MHSWAASSIPPYLMQANWREALTMTENKMLGARVSLMQRRRGTQGEAICSAGLSGMKQSAETNEHASLPWQCISTSNEHLSGYFYAP